MALYSYRLRHFKLGSPGRITQFVYGFPILGRLSQATVYPIAEKSSSAPLCHQVLFDSARDRFRSRSIIPPRQALPMWTEAMEQVGLGWLGAPIEIDSDGRLINDRSVEINIVFRFPVIQSDKVRDIDDLKHGLVNKCCAVDPPDCFAIVGSRGGDCFSIQGEKRRWGFFKIDHESEYKNLPIRPPDSKYCMIAVPNPTIKKWFAFEPKTQIFGATATVLHYNTFSGIRSTLINRCLGIPILGYVGDYGAPAPSSLGADATRTIKEFCSMPGCVFVK